MVSPFPVSLFNSRERPCESTLGGVRVALDRLSVDWLAIGVD